MLQTLQVLSQIRESSSTTAVGWSEMGAYRGKRNEVFSSWAASIKGLGARPNVYVKLGGLGRGYNGFGFNEQAEPRSSEMLAATIRPYVETCIEAFGAARSMFEGNFPVDKVS